MTNDPMAVTVPRTTLGDSEWFTNARFGLFIHWGLYSLGARHEWLMQREEIPPEDYEDLYFGRFDPDLYNPERWADAAASAGMRYMVVTAKHHEGFCLWDSALTDYKATNTPAGRDLLRPMLDAFRSRGLRTGLYYSLLDWHHPDFPVDTMHALRRGDWEILNKGRDIARYREYLHGQVRELLKGYGDIDVLWADFSYGFLTGRDLGELAAADPQYRRWAEKEGIPLDGKAVGKGAVDWDSESLLAMIRDLRPGILVNDRLDLKAGWDITTPEQTVPDSWPLVNDEPALWETCQTFSGSWGYHRDEHSWKSTEQLVAMLIDVVGKGGNLLLNVGPTGRGEIDGRALERLAGIGTWMRRHSRAIYGCTQAPEALRDVAPSGSRMTFNPETNRLYLHLLEWPTEPLSLPGMADRVFYSQLLHDASEVQPPTDPLARRVPGALALKLPAVKPDVTVPVVELFLRDGVVTVS